MKIVKYTYHLYFEIFSKLGSCFLSLVLILFSKDETIIIFIIAEIIFIIVPSNNCIIFNQIIFFLCFIISFDIKTRERILTIEHITRIEICVVFEICVTSPITDSSIIPADIATM